MDVQCILCDQVDNIDENSLYAKQLKDNYLKLHLCKPCNQRITQKTEERLNSGKFRLYKEKKNETYI